MIKAEQLRRLLDKCEEAREIMSECDDFIYTEIDELEGITKMLIHDGINDLSNEIGIPVETEEEDINGAKKNFHRIKFANVNILQITDSKGEQ